MCPCSDLTLRFQWELGALELDSGIQLIGTAIMAIRVTETGIIRTDIIDPIGPMAITTAPGTIGIMGIMGIGFTATIGIITTIAIKLAQETDSRELARMIVRASFFFGIKSKGRIRILSFAIRFLSC